MQRQFFLKNIHLAKKHAMEVRKWGTPRVANNLLIE